MTSETENFSPHGCEEKGNFRSSLPSFKQIFYAGVEELTPHVASSFRRIDSCLLGGRF